jgi:hypothetical protein
LILRNLLILHKNKTEKNHKKAEVSYTAGTRYGPTFTSAFSGPTGEAQHNLDGHNFDFLTLAQSVPAQQLIVAGP